MRTLKRKLLAISHEDAFERFQPRVSLHPQGECAGASEQSEYERECGFRALLNVPVTDLGRYRSH
jgi:hypothetical protein